MSCSAPRDGGDERAQGAGGVTRAGGVDQLHFYTLNRPELTRDVCAALGVRPKAGLEAVA